MFQYIRGIRADLLRKRGQKMLVKKKFLKAEKCFQKAVLLADNIENSFNLALTLLSLDKVEKAAAMFQEIADEYPDNRMNCLALLQASCRLGNWQKTIQQAEHLLKLEPENKNYQELYDFFNDVVLREKYRKVKNHQAEADLMIEKKDFLAALSILEEADLIIPGDLITMNNLGSLYYKSRNYIKAYKIFDEALKIYPENKNLQENLRKVKLKLKN